VLFSSYEFVLIFLPITLLVVLGLATLARRDAAKAALFAASLTFYAWWNPRYLLLLLALLFFNFAVGSWLIITSEDESLARKRLVVLVCGLIANIGTLVYFKYTNFLVQAIGDLTHHPWSIAPILLPLGISFITFQKIAFLVDAYSGQIKRLRFLDYGLFVAFFPQLIAGPIVHHREVIPQFEGDRLRYSPRLVAIGIAFFVFGAFKKVIIADQLAPHVAAVFNAATLGSHQSFGAAWLGSVTFTLQVYFDFSGYSDMAIGLALLFGVRLPYNFNSPLKAPNMIEFWSRWHITLTRFLTAYIYNPMVLRVTRARMARGKKIARRGVMPVGSFVRVLAIPTMITMFIAGLWHGAGFQFIVFGLLHGAYLVINHAWKNFRHATHTTKSHPAGEWVARALTFVALVVSIPFFRADSVHTAMDILRSMAGGRGFGLGGIFHERTFLAAVGLLLLATQVLPNSQDIMREQLDASTEQLAKHAGAGKTMDPAVARSWAWPRVSWRPTVMWALVLGVAGWYVILNMAAPSDFLYFQF
jgi:D-alanyl-lipoteichoic acid acyltransferase DltB (MBOAT superfamily)